LALRKTERFREFLGRELNAMETEWRMVANTTPDQLHYVGIALRGPDELVRSMTKRFSLLR
jgi:hypothetical protein